MAMGQGGVDPDYGARLILADGSGWRIAAADRDAQRVVALLRRSMELRAPSAVAAPAASNGVSQRVRLHVQEPLRVPMACTGWDPIVCHLRGTKGPNGLLLQTRQLSGLISLRAERCGGLLVHGALVHRGNAGVLLVGPGNEGKTTASARMPSPWVCSSDDAALVMRDCSGAYWAHPWPTWSHLLAGGPGGSWNVGQALRLRGVFFLQQAPEDRLEAMGRGEAVSRLLASAEQVSWSLQHGLDREAVRSLRLRRFDTATRLTNAVPFHLLRLCLTGTFWRDIERTLDEPALA